MDIPRLIETGFKKFIPTPFTLAVLLSFLTMSLAYLFTSDHSGTAVLEILDSWQSGMWTPSLLVFLVQMMLILVLGHVLVLSRPMAILISKLTSIVNGNSTAVILVSVSTMVVAFFNWGLGLIFGAIMARKVAEAAKEKDFAINYPLIGAAGYVGLMVWHGGLSGSAPLKAAEEGHIASLLPGRGGTFGLPDLIPFEDTVLSTWNLIVYSVLLVLIPVVLYLISRNSTKTQVQISQYKTVSEVALTSGAERLERSKWLSQLFGWLLAGGFLASYGEDLVAGDLTPNMLNFLMLVLCVLLHRTFASFLLALDQAILGAAAILIQFPLYFGIMGIMQDSGMVTDIALFFSRIATEESLPVYTFLSAALVNIFIPSGGGQWAIQGPIVLQSALELGVPINKAIMAFSYGDQVSNMLQPFWALPLLAITGLRAKEILPYTLILMFCGMAVFIVALLVI